MKSSAQTVTEYLDSLPDERRKVVSKLRTFIRKNVDKGFKEAAAWGGIAYAIPLSVFPDTYNKQPLGFVAITAQKNYYSLHLMRVYGDAKAEKWLRDEFARAGKKLDMGKACVRFKSLDDLNLEAIGTLLSGTTAKEWIDIYRKSRERR